MIISCSKYFIYISIYLTFRACLVGSFLYLLSFTNRNIRSNLTENYSLGVSSLIELSLLVVLHCTFWRLREAFFIYVKRIHNFRVILFLKKVMTNLREFNISLFYFRSQQRSFCHFFTIMRIPIDLNIRIHLYGRLWFSWFKYTFII